MSQELILDGDHEEMFATWITESDPCPNCRGLLCSTCDGIGRIAKVENSPPAHTGVQS